MTKFDTKIFDYLKTMEEWRELGRNMKEFYAEMPSEDIIKLTQEDIDKLVCEELWDQAVALTSKLIYEKLQVDLDIIYGNDPVGELKKVIFKH